MKVPRRKDLHCSQLFEEPIIVFLMDEIKELIVLEKLTFVRLMKSQKSFRKVYLNNKSTKDPNKPLLFIFLGRWPLMG